MRPSLRSETLTGSNSADGRPSPSSGRKWNSQWRKASEGQHPPHQLGLGQGRRQEVLPRRLPRLGRAVLAVPALGCGADQPRQHRVVRALGVGEGEQQGEGAVAVCAAAHRILRLGQPGLEAVGEGAGQGRDDLRPAPASRRCRRSVARRPASAARPSRRDARTLRHGGASGRPARRPRCPRSAPRRTGPPPPRRRDGRGTAAAAAPAASSRGRRSASRSCRGRLDAGRGASRASWSLPSTLVELVGVLARDMAQGDVGESGRRWRGSGRDGTWRGCVDRVYQATAGMSAATPTAAARRARSCGQGAVTVRSDRRRGGGSAAPGRAASASGPARRPAPAPRR